MKQTSLVKLLASRQNGAKFNMIQPGLWIAQLYTAKLLNAAKAKSKANRLLNENINAVWKQYCTFYSLTLAHLFFLASYLFDVITFFMLISKDVL